MVIDYIMEQGSINPEADGNWSFSPIKGPATVTFESSPKAKEYIKDSRTFKYIETKEDGFAKYTIKLKNSGKGEQSKGFIANLISSIFK